MEKWYMRLTIVNEDGGQTAMAMYPDSLYAILETLDECQIPYGGGRHGRGEHRPLFCRIDVFASCSFSG